MSEIPPYDKRRTCISTHTFNRLLRVLNQWFRTIHKNPMYIVYQPASFIGLKTQIEQLYKDEEDDLENLTFDLELEFGVEIVPDELTQMCVVEQLFHLIEERLGEQEEPF